MKSVMFYSPLLRLKFIRVISQISSRSMATTRKGENQKLFVEAKHAKSYAQFRPTYPDVVFETIFNFCKKNAPGNDLALDIGCGSGQSTLPLIKYFSKVIGLDVSQVQISNAPTDVSGVEFHVSTAEELNVVKDGSVDLITIGQALHWIQLDRFYAEVDRVLKPGGSIVAYGYDAMTLDDTEASDYIRDFYLFHGRLSKYWASDREHVENRYSSLPSPYLDWSRNDDLVIEKHVTTEQLVGFTNTSSAIQTYKKENPDYDLSGEIQEKLSLICRKEGRTTFKATWPIFILMSHKPTNRS